MSNFNKTVHFGAPYIEHHDDDVTLELNSNFSITCKSKLNVTWKVPDAVNPQSYHITTEESNDLEMPYLTRLHLSQVDHTFVGFYYCTNALDSDNMDQQVQEFQATAFYVFVDGEICGFFYILNISLTVLNIRSRSE